MCIRVRPVGIFSDVNEIENAIERKDISVHSKIVSVFDTVDKDGNKISEKYTSTAGRFLLSKTFTHGRVLPLLERNHHVSNSLRTTK